MDHPLRATDGPEAGTVELVIHDGRVVPLQRRQKVRFENKVTVPRR